MVNNVNFLTYGVGPHRLSDGEGGVGVTTAHKNTIEKKLKKKLFLCNKFFIYIFAYIKTFTYLCILVEVNGGLTFHP